jgi:hypothetical protein
MRKLEFLCMILAGATASVSIIINWNRGWQSVAWQVSTLLWIGTCWIKTQKN